MGTKTHLAGGTPASPRGTCIWDTSATKSAENQLSITHRTSCLVRCPIVPKEIGGPVGNELLHVANRNSVPKQVSKIIKLYKIIEYAPSTVVTNHLYVACAAADHHCIPRR